MDNVNFNNRIKNLRKERGLTQAQIAELLDIKVSTYSHMEREGKRPSMDIIEKLAKIFAVPLYELTGVYPSTGNELFKYDPEKELSIPTQRFSDTEIFDGRVYGDPPAAMRDLKYAEQQIILRYRLLSAEEKEKIEKYDDKAFKNRDTNN